VLAGALWKAGSLKEAEETYRKVFGARNRILGPENPLTTLSLGMVASVVAEEGRFAEAEPMFRKVLEIRRRDPGVDDAATLQIMTNLASSWMTAGRLDEAESLLEEVWGIAVRVRGEQAAVTGCCALTLAEVAAHRGETEEALSWLRKSAEGGFGGLPAEEIEGDEDLNALRDDPEFERILVAAREASAPPTAARERLAGEETGVLHPGNPGE